MRELTRKSTNFALGATLCWACASPPGSRHSSTIAIEESSAVVGASDSAMATKSVPAAEIVRRFWRAAQSADTLLMRQLVLDDQPLRYFARFVERPSWLDVDVDSLRFLTPLRIAGFGDTTIVTLVLPRTACPPQYDNAAPKIFRFSLVARRGWRIGSVGSEIC
jgi:hypothetical protein